MDPLVLKSRDPGREFVARDVARARLLEAGRPDIDFVVRPSVDAGIVGVRGGCRLKVDEGDGRDLAAKGGARGVVKAFFGAVDGLPVLLFGSLSRELIGVLLSGVLLSFDELAVVRAAASEANGML